MRFVTRENVALETNGFEWKQMLVIETELQLDAADPDSTESPLQG